VPLPTTVHSVCVCVNVHPYLVFEDVSNNRWFQVFLIHSQATLLASPAFCVFVHTVV